jgi:uncharacterized protein (DUF2062 family)
MFPETAGYRPHERDHVRQRTDVRRCALETMIGIAAHLVGAGVLWLCFALGVYFLTRTGREGMRIQRMEDERRQQLSPEP